MKEERTTTANPGLGASYRSKDATLESTDSEGEEEDVPIGNQFKSLRVWFFAYFTCICSKIKTCFICLCV